MKNGQELNEKTPVDAAWEEMFIAGDPRPLIPPGEYDAQCISYEKGQSHPGALKLFLWFKIFGWMQFNDEHRLFMAIPLTNPKGRPYKPFRPHTKYYKMWTIANFNKPPKRRDRMSPIIFKGNFFRVKVRTVKARHSDGKPMPECMDYSVIDYLIERQTGADE